MVWTINYTIVDEKNKTSSTEANLPDATTLADAKLWAAEMAKLLNPLITGAITKISISLDVALPAGIRAAAASGSDVEEGGRFQFGVTGGFYTAMRLPTFLESKVNAGSKDVNIADAAVAAYITAMTTGIDLTAAGGSGVVQPCDKRGADTVSLKSAVEQFLSS